jgi:hypothetical protein
MGGSPAEPRLNDFSRAGTLSEQTFMVWADSPNIVFATVFRQPILNTILSF